MKSITKVLNTLVSEQTPVSLRRKSLNQVSTKCIYLIKSVHNEEQSYSSEALYAVKTLSKNRKGLPEKLETYLENLWVQ